MRHFILLTLIFVFLIGCNSDSSSNKTLDAGANVEETQEVLNNILPSYEEDSKDSKTSNENSSKEVKQTIDNKTKYEVKPAEKSKESIRLANEKVAKSENSGKSCDELVSQFDKLVNTLTTNPSEAVVAEFSKFIADPFHLNCKKMNEKYKEEIAKIEERLEDEDEDDY